MSGYTIDQLLKWTLEDQLIDGYSMGPDGHIEIRRSGRTHVLKPQSAEEVLCELIRRVNPEMPDRGEGYR